MTDQILCQIESVHNDLRTVFLHQNFLVNELKSILYEDRYLFWHDVFWGGALDCYLCIEAAKYFLANPG